jgi:hypothetical protein
MICVFGRKGPTLSTNDPLDTGTAEAVHRRLSRALADLGIAPQPLAPRVQNWTSLVDGVITFGSLSPTTAARLANVLEDIVGRLDSLAVTRDGTDGYPFSDSGDFTPTFEPVAPPFDPVAAPSRFHPRVAN